MEALFESPKGGIFVYFSPDFRLGLLNVPAFGRLFCPFWHPPAGLRPHAECLRLNRMLPTMPQKYFQSVRRGALR